MEPPTPHQCSTRRKPVVWRTTGRHTDSTSTAAQETTRTADEHAGAGTHRAARAAILSRFPCVYGRPVQSADRRGWHPPCVAATSATSGTDRVVMLTVSIFRRCGVVHVGTTSARTGTSALANTHLVVSFFCSMARLGDIPGCESVPLTLRRWSVALIQFSKFGELRAGVEVG